MEKRFSNSVLLLIAILIITLAFFSTNGLKTKSGSVVFSEDSSALVGESPYFNEPSSVGGSDKVLLTQEQKESANNIIVVPPTDRVVGEVIKCEDHKKTPSSTGDTCYFSGKGKVCKTTMNTATGDTKEYCCDWKKKGEGEECKCEKEYKNPCSTPKDCLKCMIYAEAGGTNIPDACEKAVGCTMLNRVGSRDYPNDFCSVVSEGDGKQFNPYLCTCDRDTNQKYCKCCSGDIKKGSDEEKEVNEAGAVADGVIGNAAYCKGMGATGFYSGTGSIPKGCTKVTVTGCTKLTFYKC
tara:strand:- start:664 stop:1548 length:885 start_codon:yes stop_codon:yes gene_type:complete